MIRGEHFAPLRRLQVSWEFVSNEEIFLAYAILLLCYLKDVIAEWTTASFVAWRSSPGKRLRRSRCWTLPRRRLWRKVVQGRIA